MPEKLAKALDGFSLIQVSLLVAVVGILMVSLLPGGNRGNDSAKLSLTRQRMQAIEEATKGFMAANQRRPCPADATAALGGSSFGVEAAAPGTCTGGSPAANISGGTLPDMVAGGVPTRTLGLPDEYAFDGYNHRLIYAVDKDATIRAACQDLQLANEKGALKILATADDDDANDDGGILAKDSVMWALMSYGKDGHGSYSMQGSSTRRDSGSADADTLNNAFVDGAFAAAVSGFLVQKNPTATFDDFVWYAEATKNTCCLGQNCQPGISASLEDGDAAGTADDVAGVNIVPGDINGDGIKDLVIGNSAQSPQLVYVVFGKKTGWPAGSAMDMTDVVTTHSNGFVIENDSSITYFGRTLATGDVNGDGYDDIVIGGDKITIIFGAATFSANLATSTLDGLTGLLVAYGFAGAAAGAVTVGNLDYDGYKDIIFAQESGNSLNNLWVIWGRAAGAGAGQWGGMGSGTPEEWTITSIPEADGFKIVGTNPAVDCGGGVFQCYHFSPAKTLFSLATGDANGDTYDDLLIGGTGGTSNALAHTHQGHVYILFGRARATWNTDNADGPPATITLDTASITAGKLTKYWWASGTTEFNLGTVAAMADIDNDGYKDLLFSGQKSVYYIKGKAAGTWSTNTNGLGLALGNTSARILGCSTAPPAWVGGAGSCGTSLDTPLVDFVTTGDVDNDGKPDILLGVNSSAAPDNCSKGANAGAIYMVKGKGSSLSGNKALFSGNGDTTCNAVEINTTDYPGSFRIDGVAAGDYAYIPAVADINGDGKNDIIVGATMAGANEEGAIYVLWGRRILSWDSRYDLDDLPAATTDVDLSGL